MLDALMLQVVFSTEYEFTVVAIDDIFWAFLVVMLSDLIPIRQLF